ncbi:MAG: hypothetical protein U1F77_18240 [Kiritimatiellia bacterium]
MSYSFNPAQSFRMGDDKTTRVRRVRQDRVPLPVRPAQRRHLLMDPVSSSPDLTYQQADDLQLRRQRQPRGGPRTGPPPEPARPRRLQQLVRLRQQVLPLLAEEARE